MEVLGPPPIRLMAAAPRASCFFDIGESAFEWLCLAGWSETMHVKLSPTAPVLFGCRLLDAAGLPTQQPRQEATPSQ